MRGLGSAIHGSAHFWTDYPALLRFGHTDGRSTITSMQSSSKSRIIANTQPDQPFQIIELCYSVAGQRVGTFENVRSHGRRSPSRTRTSRGVFRKSPHAVLQAPK